MIAAHGWHSMLLPCLLMLLLCLAVTLACKHAAYGPAIACVSSISWLIGAITVGTVPDTQSGTLSMYYLHNLQHMLLSCVARPACK